MKLICIGSSSSGNSYILQSETSCLLIEAGVSLMEVKKALDFDLSKISGCFISHSHGDHAGWMVDYLASGIDVWVSEGTLHDKQPLSVNRLPLLYEHGVSHNVGGFKVKPFKVVHDVECHGFLIDHPESGLICFLTDTHYSPFRFSGVSQWLIESNFDQRILDENVLKGRIPAVVRNRVMKSHMSLQTCKVLLQANDLSNTRNIVLLHLSDGNSNAAAFKSEIEGLTGKPVTIADKGVTIELNNKPF